MTQPSAYEQFMLELVNAERAKTGAQALAFDLNLNDAAEQHSAWMIATDTFSHTGRGGSAPTDRMKAAGYAFNGSWASAENIAWASTRAPAGLQDEVGLLHTNLMNSPGHRTNILERHLPGNRNRVRDGERIRAGPAPSPPRISRGRARCGS